MQHLRAVRVQGGTAFAEVQLARVKLDQRAYERDGRTPFACGEIFDAPDEVLVGQHREDWKVV
jgi:hypothetical protein